jgi:hypothetical protein
MCQRTPMLKKRNAIKTIPLNWTQQGKKIQTIPFWQMKTIKLFKKMCQKTLILTRGKGSKQLPMAKLNKGGKVQIAPSLTSENHEAL